jgi:HEAT repeat protein
VKNRPPPAEIDRQITELVRAHSVKEWIQILETPGHPDRLTAAFSIGFGGYDSVAGVAALTKALGDENPEIRWRAAQSLQSLRAFATPAAARLAPLLADDSPVSEDIVREVKGALVAIGGPAAAPTAALLSHKVAAVRAQAANILQQIGPAAAPAVDALIVATRDRGSTVRSEACLALGAIGPAAAPAVTALLARLTDRELRVRIFACMALGMIAAEPERVVPALSSLLGTGNVAHGAAEGLSRFGEAARPAREALSAALAGATVAAELWIVIALAKLAEPTDARWLTRLAQIMRDATYVVRNMAIEWLGRLRSQPSLMVPELLGALARAVEQGNAWESFWRICTAIGQFGSAAKSAAAELANYLGPTAHPTPKSEFEAKFLCLAVLPALGALGDPEVMPAIEPLFKHEDEAVQIEAALAAHRLGMPAARVLPVLMSWTREQRALDALAQLGPAARRALPLIREALNDQFPGVWHSALAAIAAIGEA